MFFTIHQHNYFYIFTYTTYSIVIKHHKIKDLHCIKINKVQIIFVYISTNVSPTRISIEEPFWQILFSSGHLQLSEQKIPKKKNWNAKFIKNSLVDGSGLWTHLCDPMHTLQSPGYTLSGCLQENNNPKMHFQSSSFMLCEYKKHWYIVKTHHFKHIFG